MSVSVRHHHHSFKDYLAVEEVSTVRHEYLDGEIYAMAGGSVLHAALSAAALATLHRQLGGRCRVYSSDLSPGTIEYDLGEKFEHYQRIPSLTSVVYISQDRRQIEIRAKRDGKWEASTVGPAGTATIPSLGRSIAIDSLYTDAGG